MMRLTMLPASGRDAEWRAACAWATRHRFEPRVPSNHEGWRHLLADADVAWCHAGEPLPAAPTRSTGALRAWVEDGGRLLLSLLACPLAHSAGAPGPPPVVHPPEPWRDEADPLWPAAFRDWPDYPHVRGMQGWGEHPLFDGLVRGAFTWRGVEGEPLSRAVYVKPLWPAGRVIAVDRAYVQLDGATAVAWEYEVGAGRIVCLGANLALAGADRSMSASRDRILANALAYLDPRRADMRPPRRWWPSAAPDAPAVAPVSLRPRALPPPVVVASSHWPLVRRIEAPSEAPFALAGRRALLFGTEREGVRELWCHPLCVWSEVDGWSVEGAPLRAVNVSLSPATVERELEDASGKRWRETIAISPLRPVAHISLTPESPTGEANGMAEFSATLRLRLEWPMPNDALHPLIPTVSSAGMRHSVLVTTADERILAAVLVDGAEECAVVASAEGPKVRVRGSAGGDGVRLAAVASSAGIAALAADVAGASAEGIDGCLEAQRRRIGSVLESTVELETPEPALDAAWPWAVARLAGAAAEFPGVGTGILAGLAASRPGWGDSRPGYAWLFGRDACWSGDALLAAGLFDEARCALELLAATADPSGKIAHEVTTSGVAHYDAADATPLWIRFVAAYAEWTGDLATVRALWGSVRAALDFVRATDRDGDALPENTGVGHGWIESGALGGGAVTAYTASIWIDALRRIAPVARAVDDEETADWAAAESRRASGSFDTHLRDPASGGVALHRTAKGSLESAVTALGAVPILLGVDDSPGADRVLDALATDDHSTPWGVRLVSRRSPLYDPRGYHTGSVWPLFTGWVALAELTRWRTGAALGHLLSNARLAFRHSQGAFDEVLDGDSGGRAGVCPDQTWSAAMVVSPVVQGMLDLRPMAYAGECTLTPRWPAAWPGAKVRRLRVGRSVFSLEMTRMADGDAGRRALRYILSLEHGDPLAVTIVGRDGHRAAARLEGEGGSVTVVMPGLEGETGGDGRR